MVLSIREALSYYVEAAAKFPALGYVRQNIHHKLEDFSRIIKTQAIC